MHGHRGIRKVVLAVGIVHSIQQVEEHMMIVVTVIAVAPWLGCTQVIGARELGLPLQSRRTKLDFDELSTFGSFAPWCSLPSDDPDSVGNDHNVVPV